MKTIINIFLLFFMGYCSLSLWVKAEKIKINFEKYEIYKYIEPHWSSKKSNIFWGIFYIGDITISIYMLQLIASYFEPLIYPEIIFILWPGIYLFSINRGFIYIVTHLYKKITKEIINIYRKSPNKLTENQKKSCKSYLSYFDNNLYPKEKNDFRKQEEIF